MHALSEKLTMKLSGKLESKATGLGLWRRMAFKGGLATLLALAVTQRVTAANAALPKRTPGGMLNEGSERIAITDVIMLERWSRETHNADVAASCFHPDAWIEVSWFKGTALEFIESGKQKPPRDTVNFDSMSPPVIWVKNGRAIAETSCAVHTVLKLDGVDVINTSYTRLLWRTQKIDYRWLISGLRGIYIRDTLAPCGPNKELNIDVKKLAGYRESYRYLSYVLAAGGRPARDDLPGVDRPEAVEALRTTERRWLEQV
jgi:hypothetical protein